MKKCLLGVWFLNSLFLHAASKESRDLFVDYGPKGYAEILRRDKTLNPQPVSLLDYRAERCVSPEQARKQAKKQFDYRERKCKEVLEESRPVAGMYSSHVLSVLLENI
ncbi:hypothetical protein EBR77_04380 [bacterium]|nr:hypothetical protein [bacterium]NBX78320.1 hypothetical protein [bacterium]